MIAKSTMHKYLRTLSKMQRDLFKTNKGYMDISTHNSLIRGEWISSVHAWATMFTSGKNVRLRIDLLQLDTEEQCDKYIDKLIKFINQTN